MQQEIEDIIFQHIPVQERMNQTTFKNLNNIKTKSIDVKKNKSKQAIYDFNGEIYQLQGEIDSLADKNEEQARLKSEVKQLIEQKPKPTSGVEEIIEGKLTLLNKRKTDISEKIAVYNMHNNTIDAIEAKILSLKECVGKAIADIKTDLDSINMSSLQDKISFSIDEEFKTKLKVAKDKLWKEIKKLEGPTHAKDKDVKKVENGAEDSFNLDGITEKLISKQMLNEVNRLIILLESKSSIAEGKRKTIKDFEEKIENKQKRISKLTDDIKSINDKLKPELLKKLDDRDLAYRGYFTILQEEKSILESLYAPLKSKIDEEKKLEKNEVEFFARIEFDVNSFFLKVDRVIDFSRKGRYCRNEDLLKKEIKKISEKIELEENLDIHSLIIDLRNTFEKDGDIAYNIKDQLLKGKSLLDFDAWILNVADFIVTYSIKYKDTNIELLSPGKKGIVLLLMYLALDREGDIPLIIDQPEENLDNKSVYLHLIDYFKQAKKRRQIIVVTHNPNLVLNTDAEQVIVANFEANPKSGESRITYVSGAIENSFIKESLEKPLFQQGIQEHGADILEGGKEAFVKRKDRYEY